MSVLDAILHTMAMTNHIKDIYYHIVDLQRGRLENFETCLKEMDGMIFRMNQLVSLHGNLFRLQERDVVYCVDDIAYIWDFFSKWVIHRIAWISQSQYLRLQGQLQVIQFSLL